MSCLTMNEDLMIMYHEVHENIKQEQQKNDTGYESHKYNDPPHGSQAILQTHQV